MLDLFEILRARPTTPGEMLLSRLRFVAGKSFASFGAETIFNPNLLLRYEFCALILQTVFVGLLGSFK